MGEHIATNFDHDGLTENGASVRDASDDGWTAGVHFKRTIDEDIGEMH